MKRNLAADSFGKAFLTSLFLGILATLISFVFEIWYRLATDYGPSDLINVATIIFIVNLLLLVAGIAFFAFKVWFRKGEMIYTVFFLLVIAFCIWKIAGIHRFPDLTVNREFIQLLGGITIIIGMAGLLVPLFYNNKKLTGLFYDTTV